MTNPFAVDSHFGAVIKLQSLDLRYGTNALHIRCITTCSENDSYARFGIDIGRSNEGSCCIIDKGGKLGGDVLWACCQIRSQTYMRVNKLTFFRKLSRNISATS